MNITEKVAYLKGLIEGIGIDETKNEGKIIKAMADVLEDLALSVSDLEDDYAELYAQVDEIDEDLGALESDFYEFDDCDCDCDDCDCDCDCDDDFDFDDDELYEVTCPNCGDTLCLDEDMLDEGSIDCPGCGETLEFDLDCCCDDDDCDCGCGHDHE